MPSFNECLISAVEQGEISREEAQALQVEFDRRFAQARLSMADGPAASAAKAELERVLRAEAAERRRRVQLTDAARQQLKADLTGYRSPKGEADIFSAAMFKLSNYGTAGFSSMRGRFEAILSLAHSELADHIATFRRTVIAGRRMNKPLAEDVMRELHGQATGSETAKALADGLARVAEALRQRFNAAGGAIPKLENWGWTHRHDRQAIFRAGRQAWKDFIRPRIAIGKMRHPLTGDPVSPADLESSLDAVYDQIVSDGWARREPSMVRAGRGAIASQRADHRFLAFRDAEAWLEYDRQFGTGDPVASWFGHINGMARDIAAMETFGPNPAAMVEWMKQAVRIEIGKAQAGRQSLYKGAPGQDAGQYAEWRISSLYDYLRGRPTISNAMAKATGDVRNLMTSALLGSSSILSAATDPFIDRVARKLAGLPTTRALTAITKTFSNGARDQAVRAGFMMDDFLHIMKDEARYAGFLNGSEWSRWIADRSLTWSLLKPMTQARRHVFAQEWQATLADLTDREFDALPELIRRAFDGAGIDRTDWNVMRATPLFRPAKSSAGFLRPADIAAMADGPALPRVQQLLGIDAADQALAAEQAARGARAVAEKYVEMVSAWQERAVPSGTPNARSFVTGASPRGSLPGEILEGLLQFKSFGLSFTTLQLQALQLETMRAGRWAAAKYAASLAITLTIGGGLYMQLKGIADGKDPQDMRDPRFWWQAALTGGGFGIFGDFLFADYGRNGHNPLTTLGGPGMSFATDAVDLTLGSAFDLAQGEDVNLGRKGTQFARRYTPVASTHWALRGAYNRVLLDELQYLTDPEAHKSFRAREQQLKGRTGQEFFWPPGSPRPERAPRLGAAVGE